MQRPHQDQPTATLCAVTMKLSTTSLALLMVADANCGAAGFRVGSDGNNDAMKRAVEEALLVDVKPLLETGSEEFPPLRNKILGTEIPCMFEYWSRPDIHTLGNMGFGGAVHALMSPLATKIIDEKAYGGVDVRKLISHELRTVVGKAGARVVDLCCGVGMSTRALEAAFHDAEFVGGIDTSHEMISMAQTISGYNQRIKVAVSRHNEAIEKLLNETVFNSFTDTTSLRDIGPKSESHTSAGVSYRHGNAENTGLPDLSFDLVSIMYGFHEVPMTGRARIINEARRVLRRGGHLAVVDICPTYTPSAEMLAGEPFVEEYQQNIDRQLATFPGFTMLKRKVVVPGHVNLWLLTSLDS